MADYKAPLRDMRFVLNEVFEVATTWAQLPALADSVDAETVEAILEEAGKVTAKSIAVSYDGRVLEGVYHVQTVNNYHERLKSWLNGSLRGVSTKYMPNYLAWMRTLEWFKDQGVKPEHFVLSGLGQQLINR